MFLSTRRDSAPKKHLCCPMTMTRGDVTNMECFGFTANLDVIVPPNNFPTPDAVSGCLALLNKQWRQQMSALLSVHAGRLELEADETRSRDSPCDIVYLPRQAKWLGHNLMQLLTGVFNSSLALLQMQPYSTPSSDSSLSPIRHSLLALTRHIAIRRTCMRRNTDGSNPSAKVHANASRVELWIPIQSVVTLHDTLRGRMKLRASV